MRSLPEADALLAEFGDRFGPPPESVRNLLFQLHVKLLAEDAGLASVSIDNHQIVLRYPPLPEGKTSRPIPSPGPGARTGKNAVWLHVKDDPEWQGKLVGVLGRLGGNSE